MPKSFKLIEDKFSEIDNERWWTYELKITFNYQLIKKATITDHCLIGYKDVITNQLIMELLMEMNKEVLEPTKYKGRINNPWLLRRIKLKILSFYYTKY